MSAPQVDQPVGSPFVSGQELSRRLYEQVVQPILTLASPGLPHSAALLGRGSEVLGFDDAMSTDHDWTARVLVFLSDDDHAQRGGMVEAALREHLPATFQGTATKVSVGTVRDYVQRHLGLDLTREIEARDWLTLPEQRLRMITAGAVFHDDLGLQAVRDRLAYYPTDVWLYLLAAGWWRVHPEANLVGRAGYVGDELGSTLIAARLVHDLMSLCFLMEREFAPYSKWFGTAFSRLDSAAELTPLLQQSLHADTWQEREVALTRCYARLAAQHDALEITDPVPTTTYRMWDRPFGVRWGDFPGALLAQIRDPAVRQIADQWPTGGVEQVRDVLWAPSQRELILRLLP